MELRQLRYFYSAARYESITKAAEFYGIPQPSMSQTISRLEKELGVALFTRTANRLYLNDKGKIFYGYVESVLNNIEEGFHAMKETDNDPSGEVRLLVQENRNNVTDWIAEFAMRYRNIKLTISHNQYINNSDDYDLYISTNYHKLNLQSCVELINEDILLAVPEAHRLAGKKKISPKEIIDEDFISMPPESSLFQISFNVCRTYGFQPRISIICDDPYSVRKYVSLGMGIAFVPEISWRGLMDSNTSLISLADKGFNRTTYLMWDKNKYISPAAKLLHEHILKCASKQKLY